MDLSPKNLRVKFFNLWQTAETTGQQVVRGSILIFLERFLVKGLYFVRTVILARLLFPEDFGLFGLAVLAMSVVDLLFQPGFGSAIVQEKGEVKKYLNSVWTVNILRNIGLAVILFFVGAPLAGQFFHNPAVVPFVRALAAIFLVAAFQNPAISLLQKEMKFNKKIFYDLGCVLGEVAVVIVAGFILRNAWALFFGSLANRTFDIILSYVFYPYWPKLSFDFSGARHLFKFGRWIWLTGIISFLATQGDRLFIGRLLEVKDLGFYQLAFALGTLPTIEVVRSLGNILFPLYAKIQSDIKLLRRAFVGVARIVFSIVIPALVGLFILANEIVGFVYGSRWLPMVPIVYVIILYSLVKAFEFIANPLFLGLGRPQVQTLVLAIQSLVMFSLIVPLARSLGVVGIAWAALAGLVAAQLVFLLKLKKRISLGFRTLIRVLSLPVLASLFMLGVLALVKKVLPIENIPLLLSYVFGGALVYFVAMLSLDYLWGRKFHKSLLWIKKNI